jgi:hypothetical protein
MTTVIVQPSRPTAPTVTDLIEEAAALWHRLLTGLGVILPGVDLPGFLAFVRRVVLAAGALPQGLSHRRMAIDARLRAVPEFAEPLLATLRARERAWLKRGRAEAARAKAEGVSQAVMKSRKGAAATIASKAKRKAAKDLEPA